MSSAETAEVDGRGRVFHDDLLDNLVGKWKVSGNVVGRKLEHAADVKWVLNHQFLQVHFLDISPVTPKDTTSKYEALVYVGRDNMSERYVVFWLDVFGGRFAETIGFGTPAVSRLDNVRLSISRRSIAQHVHLEQSHGDLDNQDSPEECKREVDGLRNRTPRKSLIPGLDR